MQGNNTFADLIICQQKKHNLPILPYTEGVFHLAYTE